jgi:hypothetical protein
MPLKRLWFERGWARAGARLGRGALILAAVLAACLLASPAARANSDADWQMVIDTEIAKFSQELSKWAADLNDKGESARTGELTATAASCAEQTNTRAFSAWGDGADYTLVPGGTIESGLGGWLLENQWKVVSSSWLPGSTLSGGSAIAIRKGTKLTTRPVCVTEAHPTVRFMLGAKGSSRARLLVEVLYEDLGGSIKVLPIAYLKPTRAWQPTQVIPLHVNLRASLAADKTAAVALRFTAEEDQATWYLDDLYVDPFKHR